MTRRMEGGDAAHRSSIVDRRVEDGAIGRQIDEFRSAVSMLTRLPVRSRSADNTGARMYGLVGVLTGLVGSVPLLVLGGGLAPAAAILAVGAVAIVSGALHLDGLADTADALVAPSAMAAERARKDPSVGVGGTVALILVLGLETVSLGLLAAGAGPLVAGLACVAAGAGSRVAPVVLAVAASRTAAAGGMGAWFSMRVTVRDAVVAAASGALVGVAVAAASGRPTLLLGGVAGFAIGIGLGLAVVRVRGQLDGDGYGATVELTFAATVLAIAALVLRTA